MKVLFLDSVHEVLEQRSEGDLRLQGRVVVLEESRLRQLGAGTVLAFILTGLSAIGGWFIRGHLKWLWLVK